MEKTALVWILTYAIHSTALIAGVWVLTKIFPKLSLGLQESMWRVAMFGGLLTATVQLAAGVTPVTGLLDLPPQLQTQTVAAAPATPVATADVVQRRIVQHDVGDVRITTVRESKPSQAVAVAAAAPATPTGSRWPWLIVGLAGAGAVFALGRLGLGARRLRAKLRGRRDVIEDPLLEKFFELCQGAELQGKRRPRLTASQHLNSPIALPRKEVVIPERAIDGLTPAQQHGMLAHELHHIMRRDPAWYTLMAVVEAVFLFQPLNHLARRKLQELAEYQCDDWAARTTGGGTHLAKCLAEVAAWVERDRPLPAVAMTDGSSPVVRRITRLLRGRRGPAAESSAATRVSVGFAALATTLWFAPGISTQAHAATPETDANTTAARVGGGETGGEIDGEITVAELQGPPGVRRSQVTIDRADEVVRVQVDSVRQSPPVPPPIERERIVVHGFFDDVLGFGGGCGSLDIDIDLEDFDAEVRGSWGAGFPFSEGCRHEHERHGRHHGGHGGHDDDRIERLERRASKLRAQAEKHRARAERHRERAERHRERALQARERAEARVFEL